MKLKLDYREMALIRKLCENFIYEDKIYKKDSTNPHHNVGLCNRILKKLEEIELSLQKEMGMGKTK